MSNEANNGGEAMTAVQKVEAMAAGIHKHRVDVEREYNTLYKVSELMVKHGMDTAQEAIQHEAKARYFGW